MRSYYGSQVGGADFEHRETSNSGHRECRGVSGVAEDPAGLTTADATVDHGTARGQTSVLFVCTANQCRSPFAEVIARRYADRRLFIIESAGLIVDGGAPVPRNGLLVASEIGIDLSTHRSRRADLRRLGDWDLILAMTREHVREIVGADATLWPRVFTIKQFRRWIDQHPPPPGAPLRAWIDRVGADRSRFDAVGASVDDDIGDPLRSPPQTWRKMARVMDEELAVIFGRHS
jgi:protein-tyrosine phosphatase